MPSRISRQFNELSNGIRTGASTGSVPRNMREKWAETLRVSNFSPEVQKVVNDTKQQLIDVLTINPRHESYERGDNPQRPIVSDETLYDKTLTTIADAPALMLPLADIPEHIHFSMSQDKKDRFYPDGYAMHYFHGVERFKLKDGTEGKLHGQLFFHKADVAGPRCYYVFEVYDTTSPKALYDDKVFYTITEEQFDALGAKKI